MSQRKIDALHHVTEVATRLFGQHSTQARAAAKEEMRMIKQVKEEAIKAANEKRS
ncbi:MAG: hypothetical protein JSR70_09450 [Proteobacteria bacterium]|nr:hypothetical protein [Pseudomonadota bacterium]